MSRHYSEAMRLILLRGGETAIRRRIKKDDRDSLIRALKRVAENLDQTMDGGSHA